MPSASTPHVSELPALSPAPALLASFQEHYAALLRFLLRRTGCRHAAEELAHDTWLRIAQQQAATRGAGPGGPLIDDPRAYLFTVAAHLALDRHRRNRLDLDAPAPDAPRCAPDVALVHAHRQALQAVDRGLAELPARARDCFLAHRMEGIGHDELARRHGVSVKTIERDVALAMTRVRDAMERWHGSAAPVGLPGRRRALSALLGLGALGCGGMLAGQAWHDARHAGRLLTGIGERQEHRLPDGSRVTLDADSELQCTLDPLRREVRLHRGSAYFDVPPSAAWWPRPFRVVAGTLRITALDTRFGVELGGTAGSAQVQVEVEQGRVAIEAPGQAPLWLEAGHSLQRRPGAPLRVQALPSRAAGWRDGWIDFVHVPLGEVIARLSRYSVRPLQVAPEAARLAVLGRVQVDTLPEWLRLLPRHLPVRIDETAAGALLVRRR